MPVYFAETPEEEMNAVININVYGTLNVTRVVLPKMLEKCAFSSMTVVST
jgi:short-subunit dehydrogenase